ncbi:MAG TPA: Asp-tRNA(Asn)/Glu-tRNA(Gln) amidotransferase subunit GatC [Candidatus Paceibacterota bacterium]
MISEHEIEVLSDLARIDLSPEEKHSFHHDLESILGYISQLQELQETQPEKQDLGLVKNVMRSDTPSHDRKQFTDKILASAPNTKNGFIEVKKILNND